MKLKNLFFAFVLIGMFVSCSGDDNNDKSAQDELGTHKITIKLSGDVDDFTSLAAFSGTTNSGGSAKLYDTTGKLVSGEVLLKESDQQYYECKTDNNAIYLVAALTVGCIEENKTLNVEFTAYINNKVTNTLTKTISTKANPPVAQSISFETTEK